MPEVMAGLSRGGSTELVLLAGLVETSTSSWHGKTFCSPRDCRPRRFPYKIVPIRGITTGAA